MNSWSREYEINSFLANSQKRLGLYSLLNILQDASWAHANHIGHGHSASLEKNYFWVLTRQAVSMSTWPAWGETIRVETWIRNPSGPFVLRDFEVWSGGVKVGIAVASWLMLDARTRAPVRNHLASLKDVARAEGTLEVEPQKIEQRTDLQNLVKFQVRNSDLDMNQHVNNTRYAQWILDSVPFDWHSRFLVKDYEVNFLAETRSGDEISILISPEPIEVSDGWIRQFQGWRASDSKTVFSARLKVVEIN